MEHGLDCVFDKKTKLVIMGTFPSIQSRGACYYNHPQNLFWKIIATACQNDAVIAGAKDVRYRCLLDHGIGLWDVIKSCAFEERSSLDQKIIKNSIIYNDFSVLRVQCPNLRCIVFSSKNAAHFFRDYLKQSEKYPALNDPAYRAWLNRLVRPTPLPSTSPANARMKSAEKQHIWQAFLSAYINPE